MIVEGDTGIGALKVAMCSLPGLPSIDPAERTRQEIEMGKRMAAFNKIADAIGELNWRFDKAGMKLASLPSVPIWATAEQDMVTLEVMTRSGDVIRLEDPVEGFPSELLQAKVALLIG